MAKNHIQPGDSLTYANGTGSAVQSGDVVVVGTQIGVALVDIADGASGAVGVSGVWELPKVAAAVIAQGEAVLWDVSAGAFDDAAAVPAAGDVKGACVAWEAAGNGATVVRVKLNVGVGTVS